MDEAAYQHLADVTATVADGLRAAAYEAGCPVQVQSLPGLMTVFFAPVPVNDYAAAASADLEAFGAFARALLERGVYPPPSQFEAWFPSLAHTEADIQWTLSAAREAFSVVTGR